MNNMHRYPIGIQTFERVRKDHYLYIDKTDLVWKITKESPYIFLSRPRRFGKSLLSTTLHSYFEGQRELFEGLKIMELEKEWVRYPVLHVDLSIAKNRVSSEHLQQALLSLLEPLVEQFGKSESEVTPGEVLRGLIRRAYEKTGKQVVVIIDEYDAPLLDVLHDKEKLPDFRRIMQEFYQPAKP